jgi:hypothetical protein
VLECKEEGSSKLRRSSVLCKVRAFRLCACNLLTKDNKEEELVDVAQGGGEPCKHCVVLLCACLDVFITYLAKFFDIDR